MAYPNTLMVNQIANNGKETSSVQKKKVDENVAGQRIDNYLCGQLKGVPKSRVYRMIRKGEVRVNGGRVQAEYRLAMGDEVRIPPVRTGEISADADPSTPRRWLPKPLTDQIETLFENEDLWILHKPSGLAVHGGSGVTTGLIEYLREQKPDLSFLELAHRLDRETSGCLILAKNRKSLLWVQEQFKAGTIGKYYRMIVQGHWSLGKKRLTMALDTRTRVQGERHVTASREGKKAITDVSPVLLLRNASILEAKLLTGRTHQIRVHLAEMGFPLLGDRKYGTDDANRYARSLGVKRVLLHAHRLVLPLMGGHREIDVSSPYPADFSQVLDRLEQLEKMEKTKQT